MSKMDGVSPRKPADLEYKYNFGKSFAEVYNLIADVQKGTESAIKDLDKKLDPEEIFNRLTNYGEVQGIYRGEDGNIYLNATYIKSGKLLAEYIDADNLEVKAANITGTLKAEQIDATNLKVSSANITGELVATSLKGADIGITDAAGVAFGYMQKIANSIAFIGAENVNLLAMNGWAKITASSGAEIQIGGTEAKPIVSVVGTFYAENYEERLLTLEADVATLMRVFG